MLPNLTEKIAYYRDQIANHQRNIETLTELSTSSVSISTAISPSLSPATPPTSS
jgi:hypothetical protein